jgi:hypothetical protein
MKSLPTIQLRKKSSQRPRSLIEEKKEQVGPRLEWRGYKNIHHQSAGTIGDHYRRI